MNYDKYAAGGMQKQWNELWKIAIDANVEPYKIIQFIQGAWHGLPQEKGWELLRTKLAEFGYERNSYAETAEIDGYKVYLSLEGGAVLELQLTQLFPVKVSAALRDSYVNPRGVYHEGCGPTVMSEGEETPKSNWEPAELGRFTHEAELDIDLWTWIELTLQHCQRLWAEWKNPEQVAALSFDSIPTNIEVTEEDEK